MFKSHNSMAKYCLLAFCMLITTGITAQVKAKKKAETAKIDTIHTIQLLYDKVPVVPFGDTLFYIHSNIGTFSPQQRAESVQEKIEALGNNPLFEADSMLVANYAGFLSILYQKDIILSIDTIQAHKEGTSKLQLAQNYKTIIVSAINKEQSGIDWTTILLQIAGTLAIIIIAYLLIFRGVRFIYRRSELFLRRQREKEIKWISNIIDSRRTVMLFIAVLKVIRFFIIIVILYFAITALFTLFPFTKHFSDALLSYVTTPIKAYAKSLIAYLPNLITIIIILFIFRYIRKGIRTIAEQVAEHKLTLKGFYPDWAMPTYNIINVFLIIFMIILIYPYLPKSDSEVFQGVSVFAGIMLSLGSTSVIGNLVAGIVITYMRPFKVGDRIKIGQDVGDVLEKTAFVTRIKTPKNEIITIPNSSVMSAQTINYTTSAHLHGLILYTSICVGYEVPWQQVHDMLLKVAARTENLNKRQKPFVFQDKLSDFYIEYQLNVYIKDASQMSKVYSDLRRHTQDVFAEYEIELLSPQYHVNRQVEGDIPVLTPKRNSVDGGSIPPKSV